MKERKVEMFSGDAQKPLRVLIVEDSDDDTTLLVAELRRGGYALTWHRVQTGDELGQQLATGTWDLVISDHTLPQFSAPAALRMVRERAGNLPFIIVSGSIGEAQAVSSMRAGANDYLLKGNLARLMPAVERELAEAAQRRAHEEAKEALQRTEEQLRQSQKMEAVGRLAGGIAHDFNNLLTAILGYSDLALASLPANVAVRGDVEEIKRAGQRAAALTQQLLAFSRQQVLTSKVVRLNDVIADVEKLLRRVIGEDIDLQIDLDADLQPVRVDPGQIEQMLMNLAINARDAMPDGGRLTLHTRAEHFAEPRQVQDLMLAPGLYASVLVTDTGTGMPPEVMARIFEPFFTTKEAGKGTGLGLSTAYGFVRQSGGAITVESEPDRGTSFSIWLPCVNEPIDTAPDGPSAAGPGSGFETVLVVDDETAVRDLVTKVLATRGYRVLSAPDGVQALNMVTSQNTAIQLLITDLIMPRMGGRELASRLAKELPGLKVLFLSGYPDASREDLALAHEIQDFLSKPFAPDTLTRKVRELLNQEASHS